MYFQDGRATSAKSDAFTARLVLYSEPEGLLFLGKSSNWSGMIHVYQLFLACLGFATPPIESGRSYFTHTRLHLLTPNHLPY